MIHVVGNRPTGRLKVLGDSSFAFDVEAGWDAWGRYGSPGAGAAPYGHDWPCPPGHFLITSVESWQQPIPSEGFGQIHVADLDDATLRALVAARDAHYATAGIVSVGGLYLPVGELARWDREGIMLHGGGSNLGDPACFANYQPLLRTFGCTRLHNADWRRLAHYVAAELADGQHVVYSIVGAALPLPG